MKLKIVQQHSILFFIVLCFLCSCAQRTDDKERSGKQKNLSFSDDKIFPHRAEFSSPAVHGLYVLQKGNTSCMASACHGEKGKFSCNKCHTIEQNLETHKAAHREKFITYGKDYCLSCHGKFQVGNRFNKFCTSCHHQNFEQAEKYNAYAEDIRHSMFVLKEDTSSCLLCHCSFKDDDTKDQKHFFTISCKKCHEDPSRNIEEHKERHIRLVKEPESFKRVQDTCVRCHTGTNSDKTSKKSTCFNCHHSAVTLENHGKVLEEKGSQKMQICNTCHAQASRISCFNCHHSFSNMTTKETISIKDPQVLHGVFILSQPDKLSGCNSILCHGASFSQNCAMACHTEQTFSANKDIHRKKHIDEHTEKTNSARCVQCHIKNSSVHAENKGCHQCHVQVPLTNESHGKIAKNEKEIFESTCKKCHAQYARKNLCISCHHEFMEKVKSEKETDSINFSKLDFKENLKNIHGAYIIKNTPEIKHCDTCHGIINTDSICASCHSETERKEFLEKPNAIGHHDDHDVIINKYGQTKETIQAVCMNCHNKFPDSQAFISSDTCTMCHEAKELP